MAARYARRKAIATCERATHKFANTEVRIRTGMSGLSISRAWDESRSILARDGRLFASVALALVALPLAILSVCLPGGMLAAFDSAINGHIESGLGLIAVLLLLLLGQLSITRLAIGQAISVGEAISTSLRRVPSYIGAALIIGLGLTIGIVVISLLVVIIAHPVSQADLENSPATMAAMVLISVGYLFVLVRLISVSPAIVTSEPHLGPLSIVQRAWKLTSGHFWRIAGFIVVFFIATSVAAGAIQFAAGALVQIIFGAIDPLSTSAAILGMMEGLLTAVIMTVFAVMLARIYAQLIGRDASVSVPTTGI